MFAAFCLENVLSILAADRLKGAGGKPAPLSFSDASSDIVSQQHLMRHTESWQARTV